MLKQYLPLIVVILSLVGILDAGKITWDELNGVIPQCAPPFQCGTVLNSPWSSIGPIPLSVLGLGFYSTMLILASLAVGEVKEVGLGSYRIAPIQLLKWLGVLGFGFSLYLVFIMGLVINAWCLYCLISAINCTLLFLVTRFLSVPKIEIKPEV